MTFSASGLPKGLQLDAQTGIITGTTPARGEYKITFRAKNSHGRDRRSFKLVSGDTLSLTPQMGWNSWYAHYDRITDPMMREAADIMIRSGMADVGYQYVNIDACWAVNPALTNDPAMQVPPRDASGKHHAQPEIPGHEGHDRLHPRQGIEGRHLFIARTDGLHVGGSARGSTRNKTRRPTPSGALIS